MKNLALAAAFLLELVAFAGFACLGLLIDAPRPVHIAIFAVLLAALITFWSLCMAPKAPHKLKPLAYYSCKAIIYTLAALVLWVKLGPVLGSTFAVLAIIDDTTLFKHNLS